MSFRATCPRDDSSFALAHGRRCRATPQELDMARDAPADASSRSQSVAPIGQSEGRTIGTSTTMSRLPSRGESSHMTTEPGPAW